MGAGVIPFSRVADRVCFLFQTTYTGRKQGHLIDFGGGCDDGEHYTQTAMREFIEETETMYFAPSLVSARRTPERIEAQLPLVSALFEQTLAEHPHWWCQRSQGRNNKPKDWRTYFIEVPYREVKSMNRAWKKDAGERFSKRRKLFWIEGETLLDIYANSPKKLWKRVRQLEEMDATVEEIIRHKLQD